MVESRVCCITGGSRGIGRELVKAFSAEGFRVAFSYKNDKSIKLANSLCQPKRVCAVQCDSSFEASAEKLLNKAMCEFGRVDLLINNAGIALYKLIQDTTEQDMQNVLLNNLNSVMVNTKVFIRHFLSQRSGNIINISSIWGAMGSAMESVYSASKAGIIAFAKSIAKEVGNAGIIINSILAGAIDTEMIAQFSDHEVDELKSSIPLNRIGRPDDIANLALFLANVTYMTGQAVVSDGGISL